MTPLWSPSAERIADANLTRFMRFSRERHQAPIHDYASLHRWSVEYPEHFWDTLWDFAEVRAERKATQVLTDGNRMPGAKWFVGARFNYAENLLRLNDDTPAIVFRNERGERRELSWRQLRGEVARIADGLRRTGVKSGDRVAGCLPNVPEAVIAMLATTSIGAIWSSCSPDSDLVGLRARLGQITPKVLFAADGYSSAGKMPDCMPAIRAVAEKIDSIERVVIVACLNSQPATGSVADSIAFAHFGSLDAKLSFAQLPFEHPAFILYSSSTAGAPKGIVHSAGGALLQQLKEHLLHEDLRRADRYFQFTTCGQMMWNALASGLSAGATIVLFDAAPLQPEPRLLWRVADEEQLTIFGTSPRFLTACEQAGVKPGVEFNLSALRAIISAGSPQPCENYRYVYRDVKDDVQLAAICDSADAMACFGLGCPILPVYEGETQCLGLGMKTEIFDDHGKPLMGEPGRLVCTLPFPSVPLGLWSDTEGSRFQAAYFERYPNAWWHGDFATITPRGGLIVHPREPKQ